MLQQDFQLYAKTVDFIKVFQIIIPPDSPFAIKQHCLTNGIGEKHTFPPTTQRQRIRHCPIPIDPCYALSYLGAYSLRHLWVHTFRIKHRYVGSLPGRNQLPHRIGQHIGRPQPGGTWRRDLQAVGIIHRDIKAIGAKILEEHKDEAGYDQG